MNIVWISGVLSLTYMLVLCFMFLWKLFRYYFLTKFGFVKNLKTYGEWAVVTGASDGIGREYAKQLAKKGLNIVLISRNMSKLETVKNEIKRDINVNVKIIVFDFVKNTNYSELKKELETLDVGILVNNVGISLGTLLPYHECSIEKVEEVLKCNISSDIHLTHIVLDGMVQRKRGIVIHVSSGSILIDIPFVNVYSSTKMFMQKFTNCLRLENLGVIEHQLLVPLYVSTKLSKMVEAPTIPSSEAYVRQAIRTIGLMDISCGYWSHEIVVILMRLLPQWIISSAYKHIRASRLKKKD